VDYTDSRSGGPARTDAGWLDEQADIAYNWSNSVDADDHDRRLRDEQPAFRRAETAADWSASSRDLEA
jgi:hypothetical protein